LPESIDTAELIETEIEEPKHLLQGVMRKKQVTKLSGASKTYKSWTTMELAVAVSQGSKFLKWEANAGRVFYVDTELEKYDFRKRLGDIANAKGVSIDPGDITYMSLRGLSTSLDKLVSALKKRARGYDLIVIDAIYSVLGAREENSNEDIAQIGGLLLQLAEATGAAVVFTHHFSKGSKVGIRGIEKSSGAGAWGRFPDCSIAIDQHSEDGCFNVEVDTRTFAPIKPFVVRRSGSVWSVESEMKVEHKASNNAASLNDILQVLGDQIISPGEWEEQVCATLRIKPRTFQDRKAKAIKLGLVAQEGKGKATTCKLADGVARNPNNGRYELPKFEFTAKQTSQALGDDCEDDDEITV
jgi:AAA domain